jgi:TrmH family RNA methyltransferase
MVSVIFVEPESSGNIGSIARCMKNFGAHQLILVAPCPLEGAQKMAVHAHDILENAVIVDRFDDALALVDTAVGTTSETSGFVREAVTPWELNCMENVGIVIGRESRGLTNEELEKCDLVVSIPSSEAYPVLNAASACCILLYELFTCEEKVRPQSGREPPQKKRIIEEFERISDLIEKRPHRKRIWKIAVKRVFFRTGLTNRETTILLGIFRRIRTVLEATLSQKR